MRCSRNTAGEDKRGTAHGRQRDASAAGAGEHTHLANASSCARGYGDIRVKDAWSRGFRAEREREHSPNAIDHFRSLRRWEIKVLDVVGNRQRRS